MKQIFKYAPLCALLLLSHTAQAFEAANGCTVDNIIIGDGTAGCLIANQLSQIESVLVIEIGQNRTTDPIVTSPITNPAELAVNPKFALYTGSATAIAGLPGFGGVLQYSQGRMWGGSSAHNLLASVRGDPIFWNKMAVISDNPLFNYVEPNGILGFAKKLEHYTSMSAPVDLTQRGINGPVFITQGPGYNPADPLQAAIVANTTSPSVADYNAGVTLAVSVVQEWITPPPNSVRSFSASAFEDATVVTPDGMGVNGHSLRILSGAFATRILFSGNKAIGVQYYQNNQFFNVFARKRVILCAGCPFSAQLLQLSGIGSKDDFVSNGTPYPGLDTLGIPVVVNNPNVGSGLKMHYGPVAVANTLLSTNEALAFIDARAPGGGPVLPYNDPTTIGTRKFQYIAFPEIALINTETLLALGVTAGFGEFTSFIAWNLQPKSTGTAFIVDNNPFTFPKLVYNLYSDGDVTDPTSDVSAAVAALKIAANIVGGAANMLYPRPADYAAGDVRLAEIAVAELDDSLLTVTNHYCGTCNFGTVVDSNFKVIGTQNVYVVDNSVNNIPETGNTSELAYMDAMVFLASNGIPFAAPLA